MFFTYSSTGWWGYYIQPDKEGVGLLHISGQGGRVITDRQTRRQGYYIQTSEEAGYYIQTNEEAEYYIHINKEAGYYIQTNEEADYYIQINEEAGYYI